MATFLDSLTRIRRFLRDTEGAIWTDEMVRSAFNSGALEVSQKALPLATVGVWAWPPRVDSCHVHPWEQTYCDGDIMQMLAVWQAEGASVCHVWEPVHWQDSTSVADEGECITVPIDCGYCTPNRPLPIPLHRNLHRPLFSAFDKDAISQASFRDIVQRDRSYKTRTGEVESFYRRDEWHHEIVLYPQPASITWQEPDESTGFSDTYGLDTGGDLDFSDHGVVVDSLDADGALLMVYESYPQEIDADTGSWSDPLDLPAFMVKYVEYAALERLYSMDTDGFIPSLRDFWKMRKEVGINALKTYRRRRLTSATFTMGNPRREQKPYPKLPSGYPSI